MGYSPHTGLAVGVGVGSDVRAYWDIGGKRPTNYPHIKGHLNQRGYNSNIDTNIDNNIIVIAVFPDLKLI